VALRLRWINRGALPHGERPRALVKGPCHASLPDVEPNRREMALPVMLKLGRQCVDGRDSAGRRYGHRSGAACPGMTSLACKPIDESYVDPRAMVTETATPSSAGAITARDRAASRPRPCAIWRRVVMDTQISRIPWREHRELMESCRCLFAEPGDGGALERGAGTLRCAFACLAAWRPAEWELGIRP